METEDLTKSEFAVRLEGRFHGVLAWRQLDELWSRLRTAPDGWYVSMSGKPHEAPAQPVSADEFDRFIEEVDALLRKEHREDYCGIVYVDAPDRPEFVKIYDPNHLGSSCGGGGGIEPRWVLSRIPPDPIEAAMPLPGNRLRWWQKLFGAAS
ncbi:MAG TPA: hypothetical protein VF816_08740 [Rhodocyclaceae bacterium]